MQKRLQRRKARQSIENPPKPDLTPTPTIPASHSPPISTLTDTSSITTTDRNLFVDLTPSRRFHPENIYADHFTQEDIEVPAGKWVYLACPCSKGKCPECHKHPRRVGYIVVAIDGACSNNGKAGARSSIGVYYGIGNDLNTSLLLGSREKHTSQIAELEACCCALLNVIRVMGDPPDGERLQSVVVKSDSEYVVRGVTEWLPRWKGNGWKNSRGVQVANVEYFQRIESLVEVLEEDISVKFWLVPRELNCEADGLAKAALEGGLG